MYTAICILLHTLFNPSNQNELLLGFIYRHRPTKIPPCAPPFLYIKRRSRIDLDIQNSKAFSDAGLSAVAMGGIFIIV